MTEHCSSETVTRYFNGGLSPDELIAVDDHLASCPECRERARQGLDIDSRTATLASAGFARQSAHPGYEALEAYVDERLDSIERDVVDAHVSVCAVCREDLGDLRQTRAMLQLEPAATPAGQRMARFVSALLRPRLLRVAGAAAAAAVVIWVVLSSGIRNGSPPPGNQAAGEVDPAGGGPGTAGASPVAVLQDGAGEVALTSGGDVSGLPDLPVTIREGLATALATGRIGVVATASLAGVPGVLRGPAAESAFDVVSPAGTVVESDRPTFRWTRHPAATAYRVSVFDRSFNEIAVSPEIAATATEWAPSSPLPRGGVYLWQVAATTPEGSATVPTPPASEARFSVLDEARAADIERVRRNAADSHLALAIAFARAGMRPEAERELRALVQRNPDSQLARELLDSVAARP